jgi:isopenicillin N synthase-like dioxygenase
MTITTEKCVMHVPTIDISPYIHDPTSAEALQIVSRGRDACMTIGFFELIGHGVPRSLQKQVFAAAEALFSLPVEEKKKMDKKLLNGLSNRGYELMGTQTLQQGARADQKEV